MRRILISCALICTVTFAHAQTKEDGSWWKNLTPAFKLGYVAGFTRGSELTTIGNTVGCLAMWSELKAIKATYTLEQWKSVCTPQSNFDGVSMGQFVDGLNSFYADYRNQRIEFGSAIEYVRDEIKGKPSAELEANLDRLRKCYADMTACVSEKQ